MSKNNTAIINVTDNKGTKLKVNLDNTKEYCRFFGLKGAEMNWEFISSTPEVMEKLLGKATASVDGDKPGLGLSKDLCSGDWSGAFGKIRFRNLCVEILQIALDCEYVTVEEYNAAIDSWGGNAPIGSNIGEEQAQAPAEETATVEAEENVTVNQDSAEDAEKGENTMNNNTNTQGTKAAAQGQGRNVKRDAASEARINDIAAVWFNKFADMGANAMNFIGTNINKGLEVYGEEIVPDVKAKASEAWKEAQDEKIAGSVDKVHGCLMNIRRFSCGAYRRLIRLYEANGWVRTAEIKEIIEESLDEAVFRFSPKADKNREEYLEEGKKLMAAMAGLRDCIKKAARKVKELLGVDVKGTIANKVYTILKRVGSLLLFGGKVVISVGMWVFAAISSFAIFVGGVACKAVSWLFLYLKGAILNGKKPAASAAVDVFEDEDEDDLEMEDVVDDEITRMKARNAAAKNNKPATC